MSLHRKGPFCLPHLAPLAYTMCSRGAAHAACWLVSAGEGQQGFGELGKQHLQVAVLSAVAPVWWSLPRLCTGLGSAVDLPCDVC